MECNQCVHGKIVTRLANMVYCSWFTDCKEVSEANHCIEFVDKKLLKEKKDENQDN